MENLLLLGDDNFVNLLQRRYNTEPNTINGGRSFGLSKSGQTCSQLKRAIRHIDWSTTSSVVINIGTNDVISWKLRYQNIIQDRSRPTMNRADEIISHSNYLVNLQDIVLTLRQQGVRVFVCTITPIVRYNCYPVLRDAIRLISRKICDCFIGMKEVTVIDLFKIFLNRRHQPRLELYEQDTQQGTEDLIYWSIEGQKRVTNLLDQHIRGTCDDVNPLMY